MAGTMAATRGRAGDEKTAAAQVVPAALEEPCVKAAKTTTTRKMLTVRGETLPTLKPLTMAARRSQSSGLDGN